MNYDLVIDARKEHDAQTIIKFVENFNFQPRFNRIIINREFESADDDKEIVEFCCKNYTYKWDLTRALNENVTDCIKNCTSQYFLLIELENEFTQEIMDNICKNINQKQWLIKGGGFRFVNRIAHNICAGPWMVPTEWAAEAYNNYLAKLEKENGEESQFAYIDAIPNESEKENAE